MPVLSCMTHRRGQLIKALTYLLLRTVSWAKMPKRVALRAKKSSPTRLIFAVKTHQSTSLVTVERQKARTRPTMVYQKSVKVDLIAHSPLWLAGIQLETRLSRQTRHQIFQCHRIELMVTRMTICCSSHSLTKPHSQASSPQHTSHQDYQWSKRKLQCTQDTHSSHKCTLQDTLVHQTL